ncbi:MAG: hypothetical protein JSS14_14435 [Proteobacteria bacterium]|nr:hypothetical protein [Pseudomonadota bacterium]
MTEQIRAFTPEDYDDARLLWESMEGVGITDSDPAKVLKCSSSDPGLSFSAFEGARLVGTILVGHDGRRGHIHHLAIHSQSTRKALAKPEPRVGTQAGERGPRKVGEVGIQECHLLIFQEYKSGQEFWRVVGAEERSALALYSIALQ